MADSPIAYWKLDEASGNFADSSGNSRTMTAAGTPMYRYGAWVPRETTNPRMPMTHSPRICSDVAAT